ncbi:MAG: bifunctional 5,10-methylenetetrahydrofolate dehydrogenase/5,10-methenyltetrahydrofolate cyclohydrolase [Spirochaetaceae bacterium]|nr:bifunctional 5,10-methylenetetrahydrofolate dehydrogenase/5,10-methenyltetrahydrofolate cyclohydrolase [Spirochaetaceae bacterium]
MPAVIIDGKALAQRLRDRAAERTKKLAERGIKPCLAVILVGEDPASLSYVGSKERALAETGISGLDIRLPADTPEDTLLRRIAALNEDPLVHGILVQLPLPGHIHEEKIIMAIAPAKDVDGFHPVSLGNLMAGRKGFVPCTPLGVLHILKEYAIPTDGARAVILGRSNIVGKPLANLLVRKDSNATVTICHTGTRDPASVCREADILIAAAGQPGLVSADMVKEGAAVIDVGINRVPDPEAKKGYRIRGDVDFESVREKAAFLTPVPGGVGLMTVALLLHNVLDAAEGV